MDPLSFCGISVASYRVGVAYYRALDTIKHGRKVESVLRAFSTEQIIYREYRYYFSSLIHTSVLESNEIDLWSNASIRTALEAEYGMEKAHSILATLWEIEENIKEIYALFSWGLKANNEGRYDKQGEKALLVLRSYLASGIIITPTQHSILENLEEQIERIKSLNKDVSRLLSCPNQLKISGTAATASRITLPKTSTFQNIESKLHSTYSTLIPAHSMNILEQLHSLPSHDTHPETQKTPHLPPSSLSPLPINQDFVLPSYSMNLPPKLPWWKILLASPHRSFFIVQALLFFLGIGVTIAWTLWKGDLGTATGCGGLVFAIGSTANMVWDRCHPSPGSGVKISIKDS